MHWDVSLPAQQGKRRKHVYTPFSSSDFPVAWLNNYSQQSEPMKRIKWLAILSLFFSDSLCSFLLFSSRDWQTMKIFFCSIYLQRGYLNLNRIFMSYLQHWIRIVNWICLHWVKRRKRLTISHEVNRLSILFRESMTVKHLTEDDLICIITYLLTIFFLFCFCLIPIIDHSSNFT